MCEAFEPFECEYLQSIISIICTPKKINFKTNKYEYDEVHTPLEKKRILDWVSHQSFSETFDALTSFKHECTNFCVTDLRFDLIEFLREENILTIVHWNNTINILDLLSNLFVELGMPYNTTSRTKEYIDYFWDWVEELDPKALTDYRFNQSNRSLAHFIMRGFDRDLKLKYLENFINLWDKFYPDEEIPMDKSIIDEIDGENIYIMLIREFASDHLKQLFKRASYDVSKYKWKQLDYDYSISKEHHYVPLIPSLYKEFDYLTNPEDIKKFEKTIEVLINDGNISL